MGGLVNEFESNLTMRERQVTKFDAKEDILKSTV